MHIKDHIYKVRVYHQDTDAQGVVHHATYLNYLERARAEALRSRGFLLAKLLSEHDAQFAIISIKADYFKPAVLDQELDIVTNSEPIRNTEVNFCQTVFSTGENRAMLFRADINLVCLDSKFRPRARPSILATEITNTC